MDEPPPKAPKADIQKSVEETTDVDSQQKQAEQCEAAVEIVGGAVMTRRWVRFTWPVLAVRHASPWRRKMSATSSFRTNHVGLASGRRRRPPPS
jgi:hypothetical protein